MTSGTCKTQSSWHKSEPTLLSNSARVHVGGMVVPAGNALFTLSPNLWNDYGTSSSFPAAVKGTEKKEGKEWKELKSKIAKRKGIAKIKEWKGKGKVKIEKKKSFSYSSFPHLAFAARSIQLFIFWRHHNFYSIFPIFLPFLPTSFSSPFPLEKRVPERQSLDCPRVCPYASL